MQCNEDAVAEENASTAWWRKEITQECISPPSHEKPRQSPLLLDNDEHARAERCCLEHHFRSYRRQRRKEEEEKRIFESNRLARSNKSPSSSQYDYHSTTAVAKVRSGRGRKDGKSYNRWTAPSVIHSTTESTALPINGVSMITSSQ